MRPEDGSTAEGGKTIAETRAQVNEVVDIMRVNIDKVLERDQKLSELDRRADELQVGARQFEQQTGRLKRRYWLQNLKMILIIIAIAVVVLIIIVVWATSGSSGSYAPAPTPAPTAAPDAESG